MRRASCRSWGILLSERSGVFLGGKEGWKDGQRQLLWRSAGQRSGSLVTQSLAIIRSRMVGPVFRAVLLLPLACAGFLKVPGVRVGT